MIERELGRGATATVFFARDTKHDRPVAIKVVDDDIGVTLGAERFLLEIQIASHLSHPNILPLHDSGAVNGILYYVMPFVSGETLRVKLERERRLPVDEAVRLTREIADALDYAHRQGIVHRDIKPENVLLSDGHAVVADFGIARAIKAADNPRLTQTGLAIGTPAYMSPEQATGQGELDGRSDVYSLACVLFEMIAGEPPFKGDSAGAVITKRFIVTPPSVRQYRPGVSESLDRAIQRAMAPDRDIRYATAGDFAVALEAHGSDGIRDKSIVVLPFANLSSDPENDYFSDGLTEELIADLTRVEALLVISRTSAMLLKGTREDIPAIGRRLGVRYVLEGSVRKAGGNIRITAQLVDARNDAHIWAGKYTGTIDDVFDLQERVSREIVAALDVTLTAAEDRTMAARPVGNALVYDCYLRSRHELNAFTLESLDRAIALLERGLELFPNNPLLEGTLGFAEIGRARAALDETSFQRAEARARRLLADAPDVAQTHALLGNIAFERGQLVAASRHLQRALALDPVNGDALAGLLLVYLYAGRIELARPIVARANAADPLTGTSWSLAAVLEWFAGRFPEALLPARKAIDIDPENGMARWCLGYTRALNRDIDGAGEIALWMNGRDANSPYACQLTALVDAARGHSDRALATLAPFAEANLNHHLSFHIAESFIAAGDHTRGLALLEDAMNKGFHPYDFVREFNPLLDPIRSHPGFARILHAAHRGWAAFDTPG